MDTLVKAEKRTAERFEQREAQKTKRGATYVAHTEGRALCEALLPDLAEFEKLLSRLRGLSVLFVSSHQRSWRSSH
jgi:hypothetical protein